MTPADFGTPSSPLSVPNPRNLPSFGQILLEPPSVQMSYVHAPSGAGPSDRCITGNINQRSLARSLPHCVVCVGAALSMGLEEEYRIVRISWVDLN